MNRLSNKAVLCIAAAAGAVGLMAGTVISGDHQKQMSEEEMMQMWMEMSTPGEEHAEMMKFAGEWNNKNTHWMAPGAPPETNTSTTTYKPIMGGRYLLETVKGTMDMGDGNPMPWEGMNILAYDKMTGMHKFCWIDSMGTGMFVGEGEASSDGKTITYFTKNVPSWTTGEMTTYKTVATHINENNTSLKMFEKMPDGSWFQNMEITSSRASGHAHAH